MYIFKAEISACCSEEQKILIAPDYNYAACVFYTFSAKQLMLEDCKSLVPE